MEKKREADQKCEEEKKRDWGQGGSRSTRLKLNEESYPSITGVQEKRQEISKLKLISGSEGKEGVF